MPPVNKKQRKKPMTKKPDPTLKAKVEQAKQVVEKVKAKTNGGPVEFELTPPEREAMNLVVAKTEIADERLKVARDMQALALQMRQQWMNTVIRQRPVPAGRSVSVDTQRGVIVVGPAQEKPSVPPPTP